jgi:hypothetical protein
MCALPVHTPAVAAGGVVTAWLLYATLTTFHGAKMSFKFNPPTLNALGQLVKTCHKYPRGAYLAVLLILASGVSVAIACRAW